MPNFNVVFLLLTSLEVFHQTFGSSICSVLLPCQMQLKTCAMKSNQKADVSLCSVLCCQLCVHEDFLREAFSILA